MRRILTSGIKAILAIAALSTAAHWVMRLQRDPPAPALPVAAMPDPVVTGSIAPRKVERFTPEASVIPTSAEGFDQQALARLMAGAASERKTQKVLAKR